MLHETAVSSLHHQGSKLSRKGEKEEGSEFFLRDLKRHTIVVVWPVLGNVWVMIKTFLKEGHRGL